jgi:ketosteroid isomerase-like protein
LIVLAATALALALPSPCVVAGSEKGVEHDIENRVQQLLTAYAADDKSAVLAMVETTHLTLYGSDIAEVVTGGDELVQMMTDDFALWRTARFGAIQDLSVRAGGELATAFFNVPLSVGGQPPVIIRFATVWHHVRGGWLLTQSSNSVPTVGSSAKEILKSNAKP